MSRNFSSSSSSSYPTIDADSWAEQIEWCDLTNLQDVQLASRYQLTKLLGKGNYASVYSAVDSITDELVALKFLTNADPDAGVNESSLKELSILWKLQRQSPYIINIISVCNTQFESRCILQHPVEHGVGSLPSDTIRNPTKISNLNALGNPTVIPMNLTTAVMTDAKTSEFSAVSLSRTKRKIVDNSAWNFKEFIDKPLYIVLELYPLSLFQHLYQSGPCTLTSKQIKQWIFQLVSAVYVCHDNQIIHRDIKPSNILLDESLSTIRLTDFGLARSLGISRDGTHTPRDVITMPYRPLEVWLKFTDYCEKVDIWSIGCVFGELLSFYEYTPPDRSLQLVFNEDHPEASAQIIQILTKLGAPTKEDYPELYQTPEAYDLSEFSSSPAPWSQWFPANHQQIDAKAYDLLLKMLTINPDRRPSCQQLLQHPYFV